MLGLAAVGAGIITLAAVSPARASAAKESPSDPRAQLVWEPDRLHGGRVRFGHSDRSGHECERQRPQHSGRVLPNTGTVQPGQGQEVNIAITPVGVTAGVTIDAVIIKGGAAYNKYTNPMFLLQLCPPISTTSRRSTGAATARHQPLVRLLSPDPAATAAPGFGSLTVQKTVIAPNGVPVEPLPTSVTVLVNCKRQPSPPERHP